MAAFVHDDFRKAFMHSIRHDMRHGESCELCEAGLTAMKIGTGWFLRQLFLTEDRFLAGSDAAGIRQGQMSNASAAAIIREEPYLMPGDRIPERFRDLLREDFPGITIQEHVGLDLSRHMDNYVPIIRHSDALYRVLKKLYKREDLPEHVKSAFLLVCFHLAETASLNPNSLSNLWSENIIQDCIAININ